MKNAFNRHHLNHEIIEQLGAELCQGVAASFCFSSPPKVNLDLESSASKFQEKGCTRLKAVATAMVLARGNPYGKADNKRQSTMLQEGNSYGQKLILSSHDQIGILQTSGCLDQYDSEWKFCRIDPSRDARCSIST